MLLTYITDTNNLTNKMSVFSDSLHQWSYVIKINTMSDSFFSKITYYYNLFIDAVGTLNMLHEQVLSPTFFPCSELTRILKDTIDTYHYTAAVTLSHVEMY